MKSKTYARFSDGKRQKKSFKIKDLQIGLQAVDEQFPSTGWVETRWDAPPDVRVRGWQSGVMRIKPNELRMVRI